MSACAFEDGAALDGETVTDDDGDGDALDDDLLVYAGTINRNRLLENANLAGDNDVGVVDVQRLLEHYGSALATYRHDGKSAARWIVDAGNAQNISPIYLLARIETESGLVRSGTLRNIGAATGCGCPDSAPCDPAHAGFGLQTLCAAEKMRGYLRSLASSGTTISGWRVGTGKSTLDPCWVVPANRATAALYTYTPWVGAYASGCGTSRWGGSSLVAVLYKTFAAAHAALDTTPTPASTVVIDNNDSLNDPALARAQLSSSWQTSSATAGYHGSDYAFASTRPVSDPAAFSFYLVQGGTRIVEARWSAGSNRSPNASFIIEDASGKRLAVAEMDQRGDGGRWNRIGAFTFTRGWNRVLLSRWAPEGTVVIADAIRVR